MVVFTGNEIIGMGDKKKSGKTGYIEYNFVYMYITNQDKTSIATKLYIYSCLAQNSQKPMYCISYLCCIIHTYTYTLASCCVTES